MLAMAAVFGSWRSFAPNLLRSFFERGRTMGVEHLEGMPEKDDRMIANGYPSVNSGLRVPQSRRVQFNSAMEAKDIRRENMQLLAAESGTLEALAERVGSSARTLSQIRNRTRNMGAKLARQFEVRLGKSLGWMDARHNATDTQAQQRLAIYNLPETVREKIFHAFDRLTPEQQEKFINELEATAYTNEMIAKHLEARLKHATDERVGQSYKLEKRAKRGVT